MTDIPNERRQYEYKSAYSEKSNPTDGEHDMNYCQDTNCKHYGNKEQCDRTNCYYRSYSTLFREYRQKTRECEKWKLQATSLNYADTICALEINLKHKIRECEEWQKEYRKLERGNDFLAEQNSKLRAENERMKKEKKENETFYLRKYANRDSDCLELEHKLNLAEQKLEEIQHIINVEVKQNPDYWTDYARIAYEAFSKIIQKCEER